MQQENQRLLDNSIDKRKEERKNLEEMWRDAVNQGGRNAPCFVSSFVRLSVQKPQFHIRKRTILASLSIILTCPGKDGALKKKVKQAQEEVENADKIRRRWEV